MRTRCNTPFDAVMMFKVLVLQTCEHEGNPGVIEWHTAFADRTVFIGFPLIAPLCCAQHLRMVEEEVDRKYTRQ
jgi:hypothetical protein